MCDEHNVEHVTVLLNTLDISEESAMLLIDNITQGTIFEELKLDGRSAALVSVCYVGAL